MARYVGPVCRLCRREGMKLFLKGERCYSEKCAIERRNIPPGQQTKVRKQKLVGYGLQLREKQKVKRIYGVLENQFRRYFETADRTRGHHGRDAAATARAPARQRGLPARVSATSRAQARQLVRHGHFLVNGKKVNIPSYWYGPATSSASGPSSAKNPRSSTRCEEVEGPRHPGWLEFDARSIAGRVVSVPTRAQINLPVQEQLIVELYSK